MKKFISILISFVVILTFAISPVMAANSAGMQNYETYFRNSNTNVDYLLANGTKTLATGESTSIAVIMYNRNGYALKDAYMTISLPAGISIASGAEAQFIGMIQTNSVVYAEFPIFVDEKFSAKSAKISAKCVGTRVEEMSLGSDNPLAELSFYVPIDGKVETPSTEEPVDVTNPILMVSDYSCGGSVIAGSNFGLGLTLYNTSKVDLSNIKVTVNTAGAFVPVGSSNSFYVETIKAGEKYTNTLVMSSSKEITQGQHPVTVAMSYEDANHALHNSTDEISIPVIQETRLVIDDILDPGWLTMSDMGYVNVSYRNMGNNQINNLTISVEGDFDLEGNAVYYAGNMQSGRQDSYSFSFFPHQAGECTGAVTFTYEDAEGNEHHIVKNFTFNIGEGYNYDDPGEWDEPIYDVPTGLPLWAKIAIPVAAVLVIILVIVLIKRHKNKKEEELYLDE